MSQQTPPLPEPLNRQLFLFAKGKISLKELENWVYATPALEEYLSSEDYFALISTDYSNIKNTQDVLNIVNKYIDFLTPQTKQLKSGLIAIIERKSNADICLMDMYDLYDSGCYFLRKLALEYGITFYSLMRKYGVDSWEEVNEDAREKLVNRFYPGVIEDARFVLNLLEEGLITLKSADEGFIEYEEKRPT